ncbi:hypothetical protein [Streptomyces sp. NPDC091259]|uniref:hypothetical protein n=1 Tax=Streptomyces sp. NPDC091259 TaxID=3365976 RepID=UPI00380E801A
MSENPWLYPRAGPSVFSAFATPSPTSRCRWAGTGAGDRIEDGGKGGQADCVRLVEGVDSGGEPAV